MFYHFNQNNSGGSFVYDAKEGITHHVLIEANSAADANTKAEEIGIYFWGCDSDTDCSCCGDRWYPVDEEEGSEIANIYDKPVEEVIDVTRWIDGYEIFVHYADGRVAGYCNNKL